MRTQIIHASDTLLAVMPENMAVAVVEVAAVVAVVAVGAIYDDPRNDRL